MGTLIVTNGGEFVAIGRSTVTIEKVAIAIGLVNSATSRGDKT